jgi:hypothetical protein
LCQSCQISFVFVLLHDVFRLQLTGRHDMKRSSANIHFHLTEREKSVAAVCTPSNGRWVCAVPGYTDAKFWESDLLLVYFESFQEPDWTLACSFRTLWQILLYHDFRWWIVNNLE